MKILSVNIATPVQILWNGKTESTGIFKKPVRGPIFLGETGVKQDTVADLKVHGGIHKACYLFSARHYPYWKERYPELDWDWGMFGENISISDMDEGQLCIGEVYRIGSALVQISEPRSPCYKLGIRFGNQQILKEFIDYGFPGTYIRILKPGQVAAGDRMELEKKGDNALSVRDCFQLLHSRKKSRELLHLALNNSGLSEKKRNSLKKFLK